MPGGSCSARAGRRCSWWGTGSERVGQYRGAARQATRSGTGVHARCGGDFSRSREDEHLEQRLSAVAFMRRYYAHVSGRRFAAAWGMLGRPVRRNLGSFRAWRGGYRRSLGASVRSAGARLSGGRAVVSLRVVSRDRDACNGQVVRQRFSGQWVLAPRRESWVAVRSRMRKTGGGRVRLTRDECRPAPAPAPPVPAPPEPSPPQDCQGYDPCLPPGPDVDCAGGSGQRPALRERPGVRERRRPVRAGRRRGRSGLRVLEGRALGAVAVACESPRARRPSRGCSRRRGAGGCRRWTPRRGRAG